jgi:outer membrane biosynthesis protein TonB
MKSRKWLRDLPLLLGMIVSGVVVFSSTQVSGAPRPALKPAPVVGGSSTVLNDPGAGSVRKAPKAAATPKRKPKATATPKPKPKPTATPKAKPTATPTPAATAAPTPTPTPTPAPTPAAPLDPVMVTGTHGKVVAGSVTFTMSATSHKPKVGADWHLEASAMRSGSPISGRVRVDALFQGAPVQDIDTKRLKDGLYSYQNAWPQQAVGYPLTIRVRVNAGGLEQVFLFDIDVQG